MEKQKGIFRFGTSGIALPGAKNTFPKSFQDKTRLEYYASLFNSLEVNSSFYKIPKAATFEKWATAVPKNFQFTVKLWRDITHAKALAFDPADVKKFMTAAAGLGGHKGCLLIQFPASISSKYLSAVKELLAQVQESDTDGTWRKAVEFRHASWYCDTVYTWLNDNHLSLVQHDMPGSKPIKFNDKAGFIYLRFHGPKGDYKESYDQAFLEKQGHAIMEWLRQGLDVYVYFNNTMGDAFNNAQFLDKWMGQSNR